MPNPQSPTGEDTLYQPMDIHGMTGWFDCLFDGTDDEDLRLSTSPWDYGTHWYQIRFLFREGPIELRRGDKLVGTLKARANESQSYYIRVYAEVYDENDMPTGVSAETDEIDLKDPDYRFYNPSSASSLYYPSNIMQNEIFMGNVNAAAPSPGFV